MEDDNIIELYWQRDESAIRESEMKYGSYCSSIAGRKQHTEGSVARILLLRVASERCFDGERSQAHQGQ